MLTLALIVKNEARMLPGLLEDTRFAETVLVLDTGSTDETVDLARRAGAEVHRRPWPGGFAAARNLAIGLCRTPWVLMLDADERLEPSGIASIRRAIQTEAAQVFRLTQRTYSDDDALIEWQPCSPGGAARGASGFFDVALGRLFRRRQELRFEGRIHELIEPSAKRAGLPVADLPVLMHHYREAQSSAHKAEKARLYLQLSREKHLEAPGPQSALELAMASSSVGGHEEAAEALRPFKDHPGASRVREYLALAWLALGRNEDVASLEVASGDSGRMAGLVGKALSNLGLYEAAQEKLHLALDDPSAAYPAEVDLGVLGLRTGDLAFAEAHLEAARTLHPKGDLPWLNLGLLRKRQGRLEEATRALETAGQLHGSRWQTHAELAALAFEQGRYEEAAQHAARATAIDGCGAEGYVRACAAALALGRFEDALSSAGRAAGLDEKWSGLESRIRAQTSVSGSAAR